MIMKADAQRFIERDFGFRLGLTAHPTFGLINAEEGKGNGTSFGFSYGLMADFNFAENYAFNTGLTITTVNGKSTEINVLPYHSVVSTPEPIAYDLKYKMQYVEIPMVLKLRTSNPGDIKWYGQFGLTHGFKIRARQDVQNNKGYQQDNVNSSSWTRFYRAGLVIGGGAEFEIDGKTSFITGVSFNNGLTNLTKSGGTVRNHYVSLNLGVFF